MDILWTSLDPSAVLKIVAEVITAGSGVLGLLTNFKKKVKPLNTSRPDVEELNSSTAGKIALLGIFLGFGVSTILTIRDARAGRLAEKQHQHEYSVLSRPLLRQNAGRFCGMNPKNPI